MAKLWLAITFVVIVSFFALHVLQTFDLFKDVPPYNDRNCEFIDGIVGAEDATLITENIMILSSDDRFTLWEKNFGPTNTPNGGLYALYKENGENRLISLELTNFPSVDAFHPHGIYYFEDKSLLFVVNHAYGKGGERIDVFSVNVGNSPQSPVTVTFLYYIGKDFFSLNSMGSLNDLAVISEGEFYVTQYRYFTDALDGRNNKSLKSLLKELGNLVVALFNIPLSKVYFCKYSLPDSSMTSVSVECNAVAASSMYNGISHRPADGKVLLASTINNQLHVFNRNLSSKTGEIVLQSKIPSIYSIDNIEYDAKHDEFILSSIGAFHYHVARVHSLHGGVERYSPGGGQAIQFSGSNSLGYTLRPLAITDGTVLSGVSVAARLQDSVVLGSWEDNGILVCQLANK